MDTNIKQSIVDRLKQTSNVLVTVKSNPTVDQLSACIGLTLFLNKLGKHATAVFSGEVPSTIEFLKPNETLETNTNSLRDFIIALDKSKADKLRYKVEDKVVKIFITPYRTSISQDDLQFSQGDFNVDVVVALGVHARDELDQAIIAHGRILHDATVISVNNNKPADLGALNWNDDKASSLSEMVVSLTDGLQANSLDAQMATAFLTGIVSETDRFSNPKTTSQTMSISAKLMASGANQQLVATKLQAPAQPTQPGAAIGEDGTLDIDHNKMQTAELPQLQSEEGQEAIHIDPDGNLQTGLQDETQTQPHIAAPEEAPKVDEQSKLKSHALVPDPTGDPSSIKANSRVLSHENIIQPPEPKKLRLDEEDISPTGKTLATLEEEVDSPHVSKSPEPNVQDLLGGAAPSEPPKPNIDPSEAAKSLDDARQAVEHAALSTLNTPPEPVQALNAQPLGPELNAPVAPLDGQAGNPADTPLPPAIESTPVSTPNGLDLPPSIVPPDLGLPPEQTGTNGSPTSPPPVPPPLPPSL